MPFASLLRPVLVVSLTTVLGACGRKPVSPPAASTTPYFVSTTPLPTSAAAQSAVLSAYTWIGPGPVDPPPPGDAFDPDPRLVSALGPDGAGAEAVPLLLDGTLGLAIIDVDLSTIRVGSRSVAALAGGGVERSDLRGQIIAPLYEALVEVRHQTLTVRERVGAYHPTIPVLLVLDARLPFETVQRVLYTAGQAQFDHLDLVVKSENTVPEATSEPVGPHAHRVEVSIGPAGVAVEGTSGATPAEGTPAQLPALIQAATDGQPGCGQVHALPGATTQHAVTALAALVQAGISAPVFAIQARTEPAPVTGDPGPDQSLSVDATLAVLPVRLPTLGPPPAPDAPPCTPEGGVRF